MLEKQRRHHFFMRRGGKDGMDEIIKKEFAPFASPIYFC